MQCLIRRQRRSKILRVFSIEEENKVNTMIYGAKWNHESKEIAQFGIRKNPQRTHKKKYSV